MPAEPGLPEPDFGAFFTHAGSPERGPYAAGTRFQIAASAMPGNYTDTYLHAPCHRHPTATSLPACPW
jgi:hypothetical protein